jgi:hypothetical protein
MLAPTSRCSSCWRHTPRRGGSYASRGRTHDERDTRYPACSAYIPLPKCKCGDSVRVATECRRRRRHQASTTTQCCREPAWWGSTAVIGCGSSIVHQRVTGHRLFPRVVPWIRGPPGCNGTSASLRSTWHRSLHLQHLRLASDPYWGFTASSISPSPRSTVPPDD